MPTLDFGISIKLSPTKYIHERTSDTLLNWLGDVGGFIDAVRLLVQPLALYFSSKIFENSVSKKIPVILRKGKHGRVSKV